MTVRAQIVSRVNPMTGLGVARSTVPTARRRPQPGRPRVRTRRAGTMVAVAAMLALMASGCGAGSSVGATDVTGPIVATIPGSLPRPDRVVVVVFENTGYDQVIGNADAPYLTSLARTGANLTDAHGEGHPSQANYLAMFSGSTHGVTDDTCPQDLGPAPNLAAQLDRSGRSFAGFSEALPSPGFAGCTSADGRYARKHNPWVDFSTVPPGANRPLSAFPLEPAALPTVSFVIPDLCHDMHDCPVTTGDAWARVHLTGYVAWAQAHNSLLVVTFDEDEGTGANHIPTVLVGPMVRPGDVPERTDHYTLLRTIEDMYGMPALGAAASTSPITDIWAR